MGYSDEVLADSPALYWRLGEAAGATTAVDASGNARHGTYAGSPTVASGMANEDDAARTFDGVDDKVSYDGTLSLTAGTLECWYKTTTTTAERHIAGRAGFRFYHGATTGTVYFQIVGSTSVFIGSSVGLNNAMRHHLVGVWTGTAMTFYLNGVSVNTGSASGTIADSQFAVAHKTGDVNWLAATVDEVAYYPTALSAARVAAHYQAGTALAARTLPYDVTTQPGTIGPRTVTFALQQAAAAASRPTSGQLWPRS